MLLTSFFLILTWEGGVPGGGFACVPDDFSFGDGNVAVDAADEVVDVVAVDAGLGFGFVRGGAEEVAWKKETGTMARERPEGVFVVGKAVCPCTVCLLPSQGTSFKFADLAPHYISGSAVCYTHEDVAIKSSVPFHFRATKIPFMKSFSRAVCLVCGCHQQTGSTISFIGHTDDGSINFFLAGHLSNALFSITTCKFGPLWSSHLGGV